MDIGPMSVDVFEDILARIDDVPTLVGLKAVNKSFRQVLLSPTFFAAFNQRDHTGPSWLIAHVFDEHNLRFGILLCIEQTDERRTFRFPLVDFFTEEDVKSISLMAASGSLVLLRCVATDYSPSLIVLNLYNMQIVKLDRLPPIDFYTHIGYWEKPKFRCVTSFDRMAINFSHVEVPDHDRVPRHLEFTSHNGWKIRAAKPLENGERLIDFNSNSCWAVYDGLGTVFRVSSQFGNLVFSQNNLLDMWYDTFHDDRHEHAVVASEGWIPGTSSSFGKDGFGVLIQTERSPLFERVCRLRAICLYELTKEWQIYKHRATVPGYMIPPVLRDYSRVQTERTGNVVNVTLSPSERVEDDGLSCCILQFWYNLDTEQWGSRYTPLHQLTDVARVVFTPSLTVGLI